MNEDRARAARAGQSSPGLCPNGVNSAEAFAHSPPFAADARAREGALNSSGPELRPGSIDPGRNQAAAKAVATA